MAPTELYAISYQLSAISSLKLLLYLFDLLIEHLPGETVDGNVKPIALFPLHYEVSKTCGIGFVMARLRDQVEVLGCIWHGPGRATASPLRPAYRAPGL